MAESRVTHHLMGPGCTWLGSAADLHRAARYHCPGCGTDWEPGMVNDEPESAALPGFPVVDLSEPAGPVEEFFAALLGNRVVIEPVYERYAEEPWQYRIRVDPEGG